MMVSLQILLSGVIVGMIIFQAGVVAPVLFKTLSPEHAGPFLRAIFPKLFGLAFLLGCAALGLSFFWHWRNHFNWCLSDYCHFYGDLLFYHSSYKLSKGFRR